MILDAVILMSLLIYQFVTMKANVIKRKQFTFFLLFFPAKEMHSFIHYRRNQLLSMKVCLIKILMGFFVQYTTWNSR